MKNKWFALLFSSVWVYSCTLTNHTISGKKADDALEKLASLMTGTFTSEQQSLIDTSYYNISLVMVPIWPDRIDGKWLYVEQAVSSSLDQPYRQRVYQLRHPAKDVFTSDIYTLKEPKRFVGLQFDRDKKADLTFDQIEIKTGCTVTLRYDKGVYEGGTKEDQCPSDLRGAAYATTKIRLQQGILISWDQGFDANGRQVWGATKGGYIFLKKS